MKENDNAHSKKKKLRLPEKLGALPVLLLCGVGILLLLTGGGLFGSGGKTSEAADPAAYRVALERELSTLCAEVKGVGRVTVMVTLAEGERTAYSGSKIASVTPPAVLGAAVVCDGGGDPAVKADLTRLLSSLLGIGTNRVTVSQRRP